MRNRKESGKPTDSHKDTLQKGTALLKDVSSDKFLQDDGTVIFHTEPAAAHGWFHPIISANQEPVEKDVDECIRKLCEKVLRKRYSREQQGEAERRLAWELAALQKKETASLLLFCKEWMDEAKLTAWDICVRGFTGCSMVAYLIGITDIDPFRFELAPEFFFGYDGEKNVDMMINIPSSLRKEIGKAADIQDRVFTVYRSGKDHFSLFLHDDLEILRRLSKRTGIKLSHIPYDTDNAIELFCMGKGEKQNPIWENIPEFQNKFIRTLIEKTSPKTFDDWVRIFCLAYGTLSWQEIEEAAWSKSGKSLDIFSSQEELFISCLHACISRKEAFQITKIVKLGKADSGRCPQWKKMRKMMLDAGIEEQSVNACEKTQYLFSKAHIIAYMQMYQKIGWFRTHYEQEYRQVWEEYEKAAMIPVQSDIKY